MKRRKQVTLRQARLIGNCLYLDWQQVNLEQFRQGLMGYHRNDANAPVVEAEVLRAGRAVLTHMEQIPDYFVRLARLRAEARVKRRRPARERT